MASTPRLVLACAGAGTLGIGLAATAGGLAQLLVGYGVLFGLGGGAAYILVQQIVNLAVTSGTAWSTATSSASIPREP